MNYGYKKVIFVQKKKLFTNALNYKNGLILEYFVYMCTGLLSAMDKFIHFF